jgi:hypothetical protein
MALSNRVFLTVSWGLVSVSGTAGTLNEGNPLKRGGNDTCVGSIVPADVGHISIYLGKDFPKARLTGKDHDVVLMDDGDHVGFGVLQ